MSDFVPVESKCDLCGMMVQSGVFNWIDHIENFHSRTTKLMTIEEIIEIYGKDILNELPNNQRRRKT